MQSETSTSRKAYHALSVMLLAWVFDFQSDAAGKGLAIQGIYILIFICGLTYLLSDPRNKVSPAFRLGRAILPTAVFLITSISMGILNEQDLYSIGRNAFTILVFVTSAYATSILVHTFDPSRIRSLLTWFCLAYGVSALAISATTDASFDVQSVRYQVQGTSSIAALGLIPAMLAVSAKRIEIATASVVFGVIALTVTRTYLMVALVQLIFLFPFYWQKVFKTRFLLPLLLIIAAIGLWAALDTYLIDRWVSRLFISKTFDGVDPTFMSRQSEWGFMLESFTSSITNFLFGSGLGAQTNWFLPEQYGGSSEFQSSIGFGHNQYLSILFTAGLIGGAPIIWMQFDQILKSIKLAKISLRDRFLDSDTKFLALWSPAILLGCAAFNLFSSVFISRGFSLWYGIAVGILFGLKAKNGTGAAKRRRKQQ